MAAWLSHAQTVEPDARPPLAAHQTPPTDAHADPWRAWLLLGGRGAGKTYAGARWLTDQAMARPGARLALVGPTFHDVREVMVAGPSGLIAAAPAGLTPVWRATRRRLEWPNGSVAYGYSAEDPDGLRGPQHHAAWADELCAWADPARALAMLRFGLRLGDDPRLVLTTTPRPSRALRALMAEPGVISTRAATALNARNLAPGFLADLEALYGGTRLAAQELEGLVTEAEGGLWRAADLAACRGARPEGLERIIVALDPAATAGGNACGIIVAGRREGRAYVLADRSVSGLTPAAWAARAVATAREFAAEAIVAEANQGGEMVRALLALAQRDAASPVAVRTVTARLAKRARAEPIAALYEQGRVTHCGVFPALEEELMALGEAEGTGFSSDRADALVWALTDLMLRDAPPRVLGLEWPKGKRGLSEWRG